VTTTSHTPGRVALVSLLLVVAACSSGDDDAEPDGVSTTVVGSSVAPPSDAENRLPETTSGVTAAVTAGATTDDSAEVATTEPAATGVPVDSGVPGLDSGDAFCSAWSRFGGSWQVLVQVASIAPAAASRLEVIASTVVGDAYDAVFAAWPEQLEGERDVVADGYFGAFQRRNADAAAALAEAGATSTQVEQLAAAWTDALARYVPGAGAVEIDIPASLNPTLDVAAEAFEQVRVPLISDPSMVITVSTPLTDDFLATACPDQGWIVGQDVSAG
jgi:hypothetical protein